MKFKEPGQGGNKNFLKLKSGESVRGLFVGEIYEFKQHWKDNKGIVCTGSDCELCAEGNKAAFRFRLNLIVKENEAYTAKIFEQGWTVYEALRALHEGDYDLEKHLMKITRHGSGTDTTYSIVPVPNGAITPEQAKNIAQVPLIDLSHQAQSKAPAPVEEYGEEIPF